MKTDRKNNLMPNGTPRYIRCYDNGGKTFDRFTVVFSGHYRRKNSRDQFIYLGLSENPYHPQGFGQHGGSDELIDRPAYSHLGKKITFDQLPDDCKRAVIDVYREIWIL